MGSLSHDIKIELSKLCKEFYKENFKIKLVFNSFKIKNYFSYKDPIPNCAVVLAIFTTKCNFIDLSQVNEYILTVTVFY